MTNLPVAASDPTSHFGLREGAGPVIGVVDGAVELDRGDPRGRERHRRAAGARS
jgi:hypothetical protein